MKIIYTRKGDEIFVDDEDYNWLNGFTFHIDTDGYPRTAIKVNGKFKKFRMHRMIFHKYFEEDYNNKEILVDHKNRNKKDNQKNNFRKSSVSQNNTNRDQRSFKKSGKYKGVYEVKGRFQVKINIDKKEERVGIFYDEISAANCFNYHSSIHNKEFAVLNDIPFMTYEEWNKNRTPTKRRKIK